MSTLKDLNFQSKFVKMAKDSETKTFIKSSIAQANSLELQNWYNIAKSLMSWLPLSQTDMKLDMMGFLANGMAFNFFTNASFK